MAGRDEDRLADLNDAFRDPAVRAVVTSRGGAGAYLHLALWGECRLTGIHGAVASGAHAAATLRQLLMTETPVVTHRDPQTYSAQIMVHGRATGPLVGGNLSSLTHMVGAGLPSLAGAIVLLEDKRDMGLGRLDRQLTQLTRSGSLDDVAGIALGGLNTGHHGAGQDGQPDQVCLAVGGTATIDTATESIQSTV